MKSSVEQLKARGYVEDNELGYYSDLPKDELLNYLHSTDAIKRTIAAKTLMKFKEISVLEELILSFTNEKKLYTKIALSESIGEYGEEASIRLVGYLGRVGKNQYKALPDKPFGKNNYPLPRDIVARTICKIGIPALKHLRECLYIGSYEQVLEAIDAIGFISYYEDDNSCLDDLITLLNRYEDDELMTWKLIRSLQSFANLEVIELLQKYSNSEVKQHEWEAKRSIKQINNRLMKNN